MITEVPILLLLLFTPISSDFPWFALGIVGGLGTYLGLMLYFKAMAIEEASRVISLIYISPIFVLILASVFLQETLSLPMYFGVVFLVLGAISISYRKVKGRGSMISPALGLLLASSVVWAGYEVLTKYVLGHMEYPSYLFWNFIGTLIIGFLLFCFPKIRCNFLNDIKKVGRTILFWRILNTSMGLIAIIFYYIAMSRGLVSLVAAISSLEPLFVFIFTLLLSLFVPRILKEDVGKGAITTKALAIILIIVGTGLIAS
jgi:drug/metabolite transporter (DMT)-like permease